VPGGGTSSAVPPGTGAPPTLRRLREWLAKYEQAWNDRLDRMDDYLKELRSDSDRGHVYEPAVVSLEGNGDRGGRSVAMLRHDQVCFPGARRLGLIGILAMQQDHHV